jgi:hypothetical protein
MTIHASRISARPGTRSGQGDDDRDDPRQVGPDDRDEGRRETGEDGQRHRERDVGQEHDDEHQGAVDDRQQDALVQVAAGLLDRDVPRPQDVSLTIRAQQGHDRAADLRGVRCHVEDEQGDREHGEDRAHDPPHGADQGTAVIGHEVLRGVDARLGGVDGRVGDQLDIELPLGVRR